MRNPQIVPIKPEKKGSMFIAIAPIDSWGSLEGRNHKFQLFEKTLGKGRWLSIFHVKY